MDPWLALALAAVISGLCGVLIALPSLRVKGPYLAMVTLAFGIVVEKLVGEWTDVFGGAQGIYGIRPLTWKGAPLDTTQWVILGISEGRSMTPGEILCDDGEHALNTGRRTLTVVVQNTADRPIQLGPHYHS
eukprot:gene30880-53099_t